MVVGIPSNLAVAGLVVAVVGLGMVKSPVDQVGGGLENRGGLVGRHHVVDQILVTVLGSLVGLESRSPVVGRSAAGYQGSPNDSMGNLAGWADPVDC